MTAFTVGKNAKKDAALFELAMANRHGLIAGTTGTGKTVTLQMLVENMANAGIAIFAADIKGDLLVLGGGIIGLEMADKKYPHLTNGTLFEILSEY